MSWAAIILAGGASSRMGSPKALLRWRGETFLDRLIRVFGACCDPVIAVLGSDAAQIQAGIVRGAECRVVVNATPELGQLSSLQLGLRALEPREGVFFTPVDSPGVSVATIRGLIDGAGPGFVIPRHDGRRGHPVGFRWPIVTEFLALDPLSATARDIVHRHRATTAVVDVDDAAIHLDIDDPAAYRGLIDEVPS